MDISELYKLTFFFLLHYKKTETDKCVGLSDVLVVDVIYYTILHNSMLERKQNSSICIDP